MRSFLAALAATLILGALAKLFASP